MKYSVFVKYYTLVIGEYRPTKMGARRFDIIEKNNHQNNVQFLNLYKKKYPNASIKIYDCEIEKYKATNKLIDDINLAHADFIRKVKLEIISNII